jgi:hypothetical protein
MGDGTSGPPPNALLGPATQPLAPPPTQADAWDVNSNAYMTWLAQQKASGIASGMINPDTGWPTQNALLGAAHQYGSALMAGTSAPGGPWFHGTAGKFEAFNTPEVYLTDNPGQAMAYARNAHRLGQDGAGTPQVLPITPKPGAVQNIDEHLFDAMDNGDDVGDAINEAVAKARSGGSARYLEYTHPNAGAEGEHTVRISLYPHADLAHGHDDR